MEDIDYSKSIHSNFNNANHFKNTPELKKLNAVKSIQTSFGKPDDPDYVFDIDSNLDGSAMAVSLSTNTIKLYHPSTGDFLGELFGHEDTITDLFFVKNHFNSSNLLLSSSSDGNIRFWDIRTKNQVGQFYAGNKDEIWNISLGGNTGSILCGGGNSNIHLWDLRKNNFVSTFEDSHTEAITQVQFHDPTSSKLFTASVDGLICMFDISKEWDEEECMDVVMGVGSSISKIGFFGKYFENLWVLTHVENLSLWNFEGDKIHEFAETRSMAAQNWSLGNVDYLVQCEYDTSANELFLLAGNNEGDMGTFPLSHDCDSPVTAPGQRSVGRCTSHFAHGHTAVVRAFCSSKSRGLAEGGIPGDGILGWTGAEDGKICAWSSYNVVSNYETNSNDKGHSEIVSHKIRDKNSVRFKPY